MEPQYLYRKNQINLPLLVGFGIKDAESAMKIATFADGVIIGASLIKKINKACQTNDDPLQKSYEFIHEIRLALNHIGNKS